MKELSYAAKENISPTISLLPGSEMPKPLGDGCALWGTELTPDRGAQTGPHGEAQTALRVPARGTNVWKSASGVQERLVR